MKHLLIILGLCVAISCKAQTIITNGQTPYLHFVTTQDFIDYTRYCYNDSTETLEHVLVGGYACFSYDGANCADDKHYKQIHIHKKPTFEGFAKYLIKKYGK